MTPVEKAACIGGGVIGAGWVARLLLNGVDVAVCDPGRRRPSGEGRRGRPGQRRARAMDRLTLAPKPSWRAR